MLKVLIPKSDTILELFSLIVTTVFWLFAAYSATTIPFGSIIHLTASGDLKRTKPSAGALVWHLRKALYVMLYIADDAIL